MKAEASERVVTRLRRRVATRLMPPDASRAATVNADAESGDRVDPETEEQIRQAADACAVAMGKPWASSLIARKVRLVADLDPTSPFREQSDAEVSS